jgi:hypothetical protein
VSSARLPANTVNSDRSTGSGKKLGGTVSSHSRTTSPGPLMSSYARPKPSPAPGCDCEPWLLSLLGLHTPQPPARVRFFQGADVVGALDGLENP